MPFLQTNITSISTDCRHHAASLDRRGDHKKGMLCLKKKHFCFIEKGGKQVISDLSHVTGQFRRFLAKPRILFFSSCKKQDRKLLSDFNTYLFS